MKKIITLLLCFLLSCIMAVSAFAESEHPARLVDDADLLTDVEENVLLTKLDEISERQKFDVVIVTVDSLDGKSPMAYADDYYDYNGYGMGRNNDGVLLLISMEHRDWYITTIGYGITAVTDAGREYMSEQFADDLSDGYYADAFAAFAGLCDEFVTQAKTGRPYDVGNLPKGPFRIILHLVIALIVGFMAALVVVTVMKSKMKSVRYQVGASEYTKAGSMMITESRDIFLYRTVDRQRKPESESSSGGSSAHTSSSGTSHGGGGGKF